MMVFRGPGEESLSGVCMHRIQWPLLPLEKILLGTLCRTSLLFQSTFPLVMTYRRRQHPIVGHICQQHTRCTTRILLHFEKTLLGTLCRTTSLTRLRMSLQDTRGILSS